MTSYQTNKINDISQTQLLTDTIYKDNLDNRHVGSLDYRLHVGSFDN